MPKAKTKKIAKITSVVKKKQSQKPAVARSAKSGARVLQVPERIWYNPLTWKNSQPVPAYKPLSKARKLFRGVLAQLWSNKGLFSGIVAVYGVLNILFVRGLAGSSDLVNLKSVFDSVAHGVAGKVGSAFSSFIYLLGTSGSGNTDVSGVYQSVLLVLCSLAFIWALRQTIAKQRVRVRDSFYQGMYPLVPFLLLFLLVGVQLLPLVIGGSLYSTVISNGIAIHFWERAVFFVLFVGLALLSLRMVTASIFALYIVTLPSMTPLKAYRSARQLVYGRRLLIWRKLIFLPVVLFLIAALVEVPLIFFATVVAPWTFFVLSMAALPVVHGYLYNLYRELL